MGSVSFLSVPAFAAPDPRYRAAVKLENEGDLTGALAAFEAIPAAERDGPTRLHIASIERKLNRYKQAEAELTTLIADSGSDSATRETAQSDLDDLHQHFPKHTVRATTATTGIIASLDGATIPLPATIPLDPGSHVIAATRAGATVYRREIRLADAEATTIEIDAPTPAENTPAPPRASFARKHPDPPSETSSGARTTGYVVLAASAIVLGGSAFSFLEMSSDVDAWRESCRVNVHCDDSLKSAGQRWQTLGWIGVGAAVAGVGVGTFLLVTTPANGETRIGLSASVGATNGLVLFGSF